MCGKTITLAAVQSVSLKGLYGKIGSRVQSSRREVMRATVEAMAVGTE